MEASNIKKVNNKKRKAQNKANKKAQTILAKEES
jgi:hypothetical protein